MEGGVEGRVAGGGRRAVGLADPAAMLEEGNDRFGLAVPALAQVVLGGHQQARLIEIVAA